MFRKIVLLCAVLAVLVTSAATVFADGAPGARGCYIEPSVAGSQVTNVNEGVSFLATIKCTLIPDAVFGFEFGTTFASAANYASVAATSYTAGTFANDFTNHPFDVGANVRNDTTGDVYAVSRHGTDTVTGAFTLGSFIVTVPFGLNGGDSSATLTIPTFKLSDNSGAPIMGDLQAAPGTIVNINDLQIAMLDGTITVDSDGTMTNLKNISLTLGSPDVGTSPTTITTQAGSSQGFPVSGLQYYDAFGVQVDVSMESHLSCSVTDTLSDGPNAAATTMGTITLYAGDAATVSDHAINIQDATAIGAAFGTSNAGQVDINGDGAIDIYDLVQVGRNFGQGSSVCPSTGLNS